MCCRPRRMLLVICVLLLVACTRPGGDSPILPMTAVVATVAVATAEARSSPSAAATATVTIPGTRSATPTQATAASTAMSPTSTISRGTATRSTTSPPTGSGRSLTPQPTVAAEVWDRLRRPLQVPTLEAGGACPKAVGRSAAPAYGPALGDGPVYAVGLGTAGVLRYSGVQEGGWFYQKVLFAVAPAYRGPVLIRGRQLDGPNEVRFNQGDDPPAELQLAPARPGNTDWLDNPTSVRFRAPGCYAWQFDGEDFSEVVIFQAVQ